MLDNLRNRINDGEDIDLGLAYEQDQQVVPGLLQRFFRDLPDPLLTSEFHSCFIALHDTKGN